MRKNYALLVTLIFGILCPSLFAQTVIINTGTAGTPQYNAGPIYRSSTSSSYDASRYTYLYTQSELATAGITTGSNITDLGWVKNNTATSTGGGIVRIYLKNSTTADFSSATETWANLNAGTTLVYENLSFTVPATATPNYITFSLTTPFVYNGGSLEVSVEWDINQVAGNPSTGTFDWLWSTVPNRIYGTGQTTLAGAGTLSRTTNSISDITNRRPFIQITYTPGGPCTNPPTAGTATTNNPGPICPGNAVILNLSGNSTGTGMTYEWESSPTLSPFTPTSLGAAVNFSALTINPTSTRYYRAKVVCNNATPAYSTAVQVLVASGLPANTYTINNALPTGGLNYNSFGDAIAALECGITGPVVFDVNPSSGPYTDVLAFGDIPGASATNTIRFNGNGRTVQYDCDVNNRQLIQLIGTKYLTIDSINFVSQNATYGWAAVINGGAAHDSITRCTFDMTATTSTTSTNTSGICFTGSLTSAITAGANATKCYIGGNTLLGPTGTGGYYYALPLMGGADSNVVENNKFLNCFYYGAYLNGSKHNIVRNNEFSRPTKTSVTTFYGAYVTGATDGTVIEGNKVHSPGGTTTNATVTGYGIYYLGSGTAASPVKIANNAIYKMNTGGTSYGIYLSGATHTKVLHNTIVYDQIQTGTTTQAGIWVLGTNTGLEIMNNNIAITGGNLGVKYGINYTTAVSLTSIADAQRNNIYVNSTQAGLQWYAANPTATTYANLAAFQAANPTLELGSLSVDPLFTNAATGNLLPTNPILQGNGLNLGTSVITDIIGVLRSALPTPGAWEIPQVAGDDGGVLALISPSGLFCDNQQSIEVSVVNSGTTSLSNFQVHWTLNGVAQAPYIYSTTLPAFGAGQHIDTVTLGNALLPAGNNVIKAWTVISSDVNNINDTLDITVTPTDFVVSTATDTVCSGNDATLNLSPGTGYDAGMIQWQVSTDGTIFTNLTGANLPSYIAANLTAHRWYRAFINSGTGGCYSNVMAIGVVSPDITSVQHGFTCGQGTVQLSVTPPPSATIDWFDVPAGGTSLATGNTYTTPSLSTTTTYYAQATIGGGAGNVGPINPASVGAGGGTAAAIGTYHVAFDVITPTTLLSIDVFPTAAVGANGAIQIQDNASNIIATVPYTTTVTGGTTAQTIPLNIVLPPGNGYKMGQSTAINLFRNTAGAVYPYTSPAINIVSNNFGPAYYYYFYNWQYSAGCEGPRVPVVASVNPIPTANLGPDLSVCTDGTTTQVLDAGGVPNTTYLWDNGATSPTRTVNTSGNYFVAVTLDGCLAYDTIAVTFNNNPIVNLGNDTGICDGVILVLDAQNPGATYEWDDLSTAATRNVSVDGLYFVTVTDANNCIGSDSLNLVINEAPLVNIGNDTAICDGVVLTLDAGNPGRPTLWDNGSTNQTRTVGDEGTYFVSVSDFGCVTTDSINITLVPNPDVDAINATYSDAATYTFYPLNAVHATDYIWDFGDGSPADTGYFVQHTYNSNGIFTVTLTLTGACEDVENVTSRTVDVFDAVGTSVNDKTLIQKVQLYPNPALNSVTIESKGDMITNVSIHNIAGQHIWSQESNASKMLINVQNWVSGLYLVKIQTSAGLVIKKMEILK